MIAPHKNDHPGHGRASGSSTLPLARIIADAQGVPVADEPEKLAATIREWTDFYQPETILDHFHVEQAARMSIRLKQNWAHDLTLRALEGARARTCWDQDRRLAAAELGEKLAKKPDVISEKLRSTLQGCAWLRVRWEGLLALLDLGRDWNEAQRTLALDLLGTPLEMRDEPTQIDPPGLTDEPLRAARRELAVAEIARLRWTEGRLEESDEAQRQATILGYAPAITKDMIFFLRQEVSNSRRMYQALAHLARLHRDRAEKSASSSSRPSSAPVARSASLTPRPAAAPAPQPAPKPPVAPPPPPPTNPAPAPAKTSAEFLPPAPPAPVSLPTASTSRSSLFLSALQAAPGNRRDRRAEQSRARRG